MKRFLSILFLCALVLSFAAFAYNASETVYVTNTGTKYHVAGCSYLQSSNAVTLQQAVVAGYTPCSRCHPPIPDFEYTVQQELPEHKSGSGSGTARSGSPSNYVAAAAPTPTPKPEKWSLFDQWYSDFAVIAIALLAVYGIPMTVLAIRDAIKNKKYEREKAAKRTEETNEYRLLYSGISALEASGAPKGSAIDASGLPYRTDRLYGWGEDYTLFVSASRKTYHKKYGCSGATIQMNAYIIQKTDMKPCSRCNPVLPDMMWVEEYNRISSIKELYQIP